jgi:hypothetical protein
MRSPPPSEGGFKGDVLRRVVQCYIIIKEKQHKKIEENGFGF